MTIEEVTELLHRILVDEMGCFQTELSPEKTMEDLGMDSIDTLDLINRCEKKFHINLDNFELLTTSTVSDVVHNIFQLKN